MATTNSPATTTSTSNLESARALAVSLVPAWAFEVLGLEAARIAVDAALCGSLMGADEEEIEDLILTALDVEWGASIALECPPC